MIKSLSNSYESTSHKSKIVIVLTVVHNSNLISFLKTRIHKKFVGSKLQKMIFEIEISNKNGLILATFLIPGILGADSYWMFFSIALDRVIAVTLPYKYKSIMRPSRAKIMASVSIVLGICISLPISFSCFTESTADDRKRLNDFMRIYSAWVIFLSVFLAGK